MCRRSPTTLLTWIATSAIRALRFTQFRLAFLAMTQKTFVFCLKNHRKNSGGWRFVTILTEIVCLFDIFAALQPNYSWRFYVIVDAVRNGLRHPIRKTLSDGVHSIKKYFILQRNKTRPDFRRVLFYLELTAFNFQRTAISRHFLRLSGILSLTQIVSTSSLFFKPTTSI